MSLRIQNNIGAFNSYRNLNITNDMQAKSLEKLSSGFRINRAADDSAGLAISEGLRSQIGGLKVAVRNAQDGISVVQTAEGALTETHSILQRMRDLSVQASNDGGLSTGAKANIQTEVTQLKSELDRIASSTSFNGKQLLDGSYNGLFQVGANAGQTIAVGIATAMGSTGLGVAGVNVTGTGSYAFGTVAGAGVVTLTTPATDAANGVLTGTVAAGVGELSGANYNVSSFRSLSGTISFAGKTFDLASVNYADTDNAAAALTKLNAAATSAFGLTTGSTPFAAATATTFTFTTPTNVAGFTDAAGALSTSAADIAKATPVFTSSSGASAGITLLDNAIQTVSSQRANLGAVQNRLGNTINNLNVAVENLTASESRIRDTDMAMEMTNFTKWQILQQAGTAMLAQANQVPQGVLQLLR